MAKQQKNDKNPKRPQVDLEPDLARLVDAAASLLGLSRPEFVNPRLRELVVKEFPDLAAIHARMPKGREDSGG